MENSLFKKAVAEFIGTFVLVFFACGTARIVGSSNNVVPIALAFGLCIVAMAYSIGDISGCHINPAVSFAMLISKRMGIKEFFVYIAAQFTGATVGAAFLYGVVKDGPELAWATNNIAVSGIFPSIAIEVVLTFVFVFTILAVTSKAENGKIAGIVIGLVLTLVHLVGINITGTSVNPARSFGPAIMRLAFGGGSAAIADFWVFLIAPLLGSALAALVYGLLYKNKQQEIKI